MAPVNTSHLTRRRLLAGGAAWALSFMARRGEANAARRGAPAAAAGTLKIGGDLLVNRMGFGAMRLTGPGIWGEPRDAAEERISTW